MCVAGEPQKSLHKKYFSFLAKVQGSFVVSRQPAAERTPGEMAAAWASLQGHDARTEDYTRGFLIAECYPRLTSNVGLHTQSTRLLTHQRRLLGLPARLQQGPRWAP